jgi:uncharacterized protein YqjF (DUF2071 family)
MQSLVHEGQLYRDRHQRYYLKTGDALAQKIFTCTSGCPLELWLNSSWIAGHVEGDGEHYWFFAHNGGKVLLTEQMTVRYIERW